MVDLNKENLVVGRENLMESLKVSDLLLGVFTGHFLGGDREIQKLTLSV